MGKITIEEMTHFEIVARRLVSENVKQKSAEEKLYSLLLKIFRAGFELGRNGKTEIEI